MKKYLQLIYYLFKTEDDIRGLVRSRGLENVYRQQIHAQDDQHLSPKRARRRRVVSTTFCRVYTSYAADEQPCVELRGRGILEKKNLI